MTINAISFYIHIRIISFLFYLSKKSWRLHPSILEPGFYRKRFPIYTFSCTGAIRSNGTKGIYFSIIFSLIRTYATNIAKEKRKCALGK